MKSEIELSEEQKAAIDMRKARLKAEREEEELRKANRAKRYKMNVEATFIRCVEAGRAHPAHIVGLDDEQVRSYLRRTCIAYNIKAVTVAGTDVDLNPLIGRMRLR